MRSMKARFFQGYKSVRKENKKLVMSQTLCVSCERVQTFERPLALECPVSKMCGYLY